MSEALLFSSITTLLIFYILWNWKSVVQLIILYETSVYGLLLSRYVYVELIVVDSLINS